MNDGTRLATGVLFGALAGGMTAYFLWTSRGRRSLGQVGPALEDVSHALDQVRTVIRQIDGAVQDARETVADVRAVASSIRTPADPAMAGM